MSNSKNDKHPLRTEILALKKTERHAIICEYIHSTLMNVFTDTFDRFDDNDYSIRIDESGLPAETLDIAIRKLFKKIKKELGLKFYYFEKNLTSIKALATVVDKNLEELFAPPLTGPAPEPFFSEKYWPWETKCTNKNIDKNQSDIVFILSCPRSGSTIFRLMLSAHPNFFSPPELHLLPFENMGLMAKELNKNGFEWLSEGIIQALVELDNLEFNDAARIIREMEENNMPIADVYRHIQDKIGDRILVDKTPSYSCHPQWLKPAITMFPNAKFIFLTRHPYGMINSFVKLRLKELTRDSFGCHSDNPWHLAEKWWLTGNQNINDFVELLPQGQSHFLKYEDLIRDTRSSMIEVCKFLNVEFNDKVLNPYDADNHVVMRGAGDPNILKHKAIDASMADHWKKQKLPHPLSSRSITLAKQLGYHFNI